MRVAVAAVLALAAVTASACGDDGLNASEYRKRAADVCRQADRATEQVKAPKRSTNTAIVRYFERLLEANESATRRFERLDPPDELQDAHDDALKANREGIAEVRRVIAALEEDEDPRKILTRAQGRLQRLSAQANDAAERLGVAECADS